MHEMYFQYNVTLRQKFTFLITQHLVLSYDAPFLTRVLDAHKTSFPFIRLLRTMSAAQSMVTISLTIPWSDLNSLLSDYTFLYHLYL